MYLGARKNRRRQGTCRDVVSGSLESPADSARGGDAAEYTGFRSRTWGMRLREGVGSPRLIVARRSMQWNTASGARGGLAEQSMPAMTDKKDSCLRRTDWKGVIEIKHLNSDRDPA